MYLYLTSYDSIALCLMAFSASIASLWFWCLKCSLVCVCYGPRAISSTEQRVRSPFNTGDRPWGATVCAWAVQFCSLRETTFFIIDIQSSHASISIFMFRIPDQVVPGCFHNASWPWRWLSGVRTRLVLDSTGWVVTTQWTYHLVLCLIDDAMLGAFVRKSVG